MNRITMSLVVVIVAVAALTFVATAEEADQQEDQQNSGRYAELVKEKSSFRETFVLPGVDFTRYDKIYLWGAEFDYRDVGPARRSRGTMLRTYKREFGISEEDRTRFEEVVSEAFLKEIEKGKRYTIADEIGPNTIIMRGALLDIVSRVPPETIGRSDIYLSSIGEATLVMELIDAETGYVLALVAERRSVATLNNIGGALIRTDSATIIGDVRRWAGSSARKMRNELDKALKEA